MYTTRHEINQDSVPCAMYNVLVVALVSMTGMVGASGMGVAGPEDKRLRRLVGDSHSSPISPAFFEF